MSASGPGWGGAWAGRGGGRLHGTGRGPAGRARGGPFRLPSALFPLRSTRHVPATSLHPPPAGRAASRATPACAPSRRRPAWRCLSPSAAPAGGRTRGWAVGRGSEGTRQACRGRHGSRHATPRRAQAGPPAHPPSDARFRHAAEREHAARIGPIASACHPAQPHATQPCSAHVAGLDVKVHDRAGVQEIEGLHRWIKWIK